MRMDRPDSLHPISDHIIETQTVPQYCTYYVTIADKAMRFEYT
jgi:hypothetical protein